jgi:hypothetical protein
LEKADVLEALKLLRKQATPRTHPVYLDFIDYLRKLVPNSRTAVVAVVKDWIKAKQEPEFSEALAIARSLKLKEFETQLAPRQIKLGSAGMDYLRSYLLDDRPLSRGLARLPLEKGEVFTWLPAALNPEQVDFHHGALGLSTVDSNKMLTIFVCNYLQKHTGSIALFEHQVASSGDPWLASERAPYLVHGSDVYFYRTSGDAASDMVIKTIKTSIDWRSVGALTSRDGSLPAFEPRQQIDDPALERLAERTDHICIGAYDAEGFVVWSKRRTPNSPRVMS